MKLSLLNVHLHLSRFCLPIKEIVGGGAGRTQLEPTRRRESVTDFMESPLGRNPQVERRTGILSSGVGAAGLAVAAVVVAPSTLTSGLMMLLGTRLLLA